MLNPTHDAGRRRIVRLAHRLTSVGVRLTGLPLSPDGHSLLHGLRAGLEKVAGVPVREIEELVTEDAAFLFDHESGGAGVCELLLDPADGFRNLRTALEVASDLADCACEDGCPRCLFQYGCSLRNLPSSLSRRRLGDLDGAQLRPVPTDAEAR
jgi:ATP-dependent helicase YprA (DUF1998 family)